MPDMQALLEEIETRSHQALGDEPDPVADGPAYYDMWIDHQRQCAEDSQQDAQKLLAALRAVMELHQPYQYNGQGDRFCEGCSDIDWETSYPCQTVEAITDAIEGDDGDV